MNPEQNKVPFPANIHKVTHRHYKGGFYELVTEDNKIVRTRHIYPHVDNQNFREWTREEFYGKVDVDGFKIDRFVDAEYDPKDGMLFWMQQVTDLEDDPPELDEYPDGYIRD